MKFDSRYQHSAAQLIKLNALFEKAQIGAAESLFLATEATQHGHPKALPLIDTLQNQLQKNEIQAYLSALKSQSEFINSIPQWPMVKANQDALKKLYKLNGYQYIQGTSYPNKLK